jgi:hypothetical protein
VELLPDPVKCSEKYDFRFNYLGHLVFCLAGQVARGVSRKHIEPKNVIFTGKQHLLETKLAKELTLSG